MTEKHTRRGFMGLLAAVGLAPAALTKTEEPVAYMSDDIITLNPTTADHVSMPKKPWTSNTKLVVDSDPPVVLKEITGVTGPATPRETVGGWPMPTDSRVEVEFLGDNRAVFAAMANMEPVPFQLQFPPPSGGLAECTVEFEAYIADVTVSTHMDHSYTTVSLVVNGEATWTYR